MKVLAAGLILMASTATQALAVDWIIMPGVKCEGDIYCLDRDNVGKDGRTVTAWIKRVKGPGVYSKTYIAVDCLLDKSKVLRVVDYDKARNQTVTTDPTSEWEPNAPESPGKVAAKMLCKK